MITKKRVKVELDADVYLEGDLYLPGTEEKLPTLLFRTPYGKEVSQTYFFNPPQWFADKGYAVLIQDVRGRGKSTGEFKPIFREATDGADTSEWILNQSWSNQEIFGLGYSYCGLNQFLTQQKSNNLTAISPALYFNSLTKNCLIQNNTVAASFLLSWGQTLGGTTLNSLSKVELHKILLNESIQDLKKFSKTNWFSEWIDFCNNRYESANCIDNNINIPVIHLGGFYDTFRKTVVDTFLANQQLNPDLNNLVIGPWNHFPSKQNENYSIEPQNYNKWSPSKYIMDFYDSIQKKKIIESNKRVRVCVLNNPDLEISGSTWPPVKTNEVNYFLGSSGQANFSPSDGILSVENDNTVPDYLTYNHADPVILAGGDDCGDSLLLEMGPKVQNQNELRFDILCYTSKSFEVDSVFIGNAFLEFFCETVDEMSQWFSRICLVNNNNQSINLFDSIITINNLDNLNKIKMDFGPISFCVKKGEKIRIQITNGGFPRWESLRDSLGNLVVQNSTILHNLNYPSRLILPLAN